MKPEPNLTLSPDDFLTGRDFSQPEVPGALQPGGQVFNTPPDTFQSPIPELHKEPQFVTADRKTEMDAKAEEMYQRENIAEARAEAELNAIKHKYTNAPQHPKDILRDLLVRGELRKTFHVFGHDWTLRALDQGDLLLAVDDLKDSIQTEAGRYMSIVFSKVVYAIEEIDGTPIYRFFPDIQPNHYPSKIEYIIAIKRALRAYLVGMPPVVIDTLYMKYEEVEKERDAALEQLKNS